MAERDFICIDGHYINLARVALISAVYNDSGEVTRYQIHIEGEDFVPVLSPEYKGKLEEILEVNLVVRHTSIDG